MPDYMIFVIGPILLGLAWLATPAKPHEAYIGYGWVLKWVDGKVVVVSRLLESPSGRAHVPIGAIMVSYDGHPMEFESSEDFLKAIKLFGRPREVGHESTFVLEFAGTRGEVTLAAEWISEPIPVYKPHPDLEMLMQNPNYRVGGVVCERTGQIIHPVTLSEAGVDAVLRS